MSHRPVRWLFGRAALMGCSAGSLSGLSPGFFAASARQRPGSVFLAQFLLLTSAVLSPAGAVPAERSREVEPSMALARETSSFSGLSGTRINSFKAGPGLPPALKPAKSQGVPGVGPGTQHGAETTLFHLSPRGPRETPAQSDGRPNIVLLVLDATRADHVGPGRTSPSVTPRLDRLARQGITYRNCIVAAPWTLPSMASLFTGLHPRDHRVGSANWVLPREVPTVAEVLRDAGYATAGFSTNAWVGKATGLDRGFQEFSEIWRGLSPARTDEGAEITNQWIENWLDTAYDGQSPFFLFALYFEPHFPYDPPPGWVERLSPHLDPRQIKALRMWRHPREVGFVLKAPGMDVTTDEFAILRALYDAELAYVDHRIGELVDALDRRGLLRNTIVVVTADHGEHFGEHGFMDHKMSVYEAVLRVPLMVSWPGRLPAGLQVSDLVQNVDLVPTLLQWSGVSQPAVGVKPIIGQDGRLRPARSSAFVEFDRPTLFLDIMSKAFPGVDSRPFDRALWAVRKERFKLIQGSDGWQALFDLAEDPGETRDVRERFPEAAETLLRELRLFQAGQTDGAAAESAP